MHRNKNVVHAGLATRIPVLYITPVPNFETGKKTKD
jgi:hypothetical protein